MHHLNEKICLLKVFYKKFHSILVNIILQTKNIRFILFLKISKN